MKALSILTVLFTIIFTLTSSPCLAGVKDVWIVDTIYFCNAEDHPPVLPYLSISFVGINEKDKGKVDEIYNTINKAMVDAGGVKTESDYGKLFHAMCDQLPKILGIPSQKGVTIRFPSLNKNVLQLKEPQ